MLPMINKKLYTILKGQYTSEKSTKIREESNSIVFRVLKDANKQQIKHAIETLFNVKVLSINTINVKAKKIKFKNTFGKTSSFKKAIIKLKKGYNINLDDFK